MKLQDYLTIVGVPLDETRVPTANDTCDGRSCYRFFFGAYGWTKVDVFADSDEDAFELAVEWLDDNAPGHLTTVSESDYREAATELGIDFDRAWSDAADGIDDTDAEKIREHAEADLTVIGHTTLTHGQYIASHEWTFTELTA